MGAKCCKKKKAGEDAEDGGKVSGAEDSGAHPLDMPQGESAGGDPPKSALKTPLPAPDVPVPEDAGAGTGIDFEAPKSTAESNPNMAAGKSPGRLSTITAAQITEVLKILEASREQMEFFDAWSSCCMGGNEHVELVYSTDGTFLEVRVTGHSADDSLAAVADFVSSCGAPTTMIELMNQAQEELCAEKATLWCNFKHIKSDNPALDAGYVLHSKVPWEIADMLMPAVEDKEALRDHALQEQADPTSYGSSVFPNEPEKRLSFDMRGEAARATKKHLLSGFFYFKALGFAKPEDTVVRLLSACTPSAFYVNSTMGPKGLTWLSISLVDPGKDIARDLSDCLDCRFEPPLFKNVKQALGAEPNMVDYAVDAKGYLVLVGWSDSHA